MIEIIATRRFEKLVELTKESVSMVQVGAECEGDLESAKETLEGIPEAFLLELFVGDKLRGVLLFVPIEGARLVYDFHVMFRTDCRGAEAVHLTQCALGHIFRETRIAKVVTTLPAHRLFRHVIWFALKVGAKVARRTESSVLLELSRDMVVRNN